MDLKAIHRLILCFLLVLLISCDLSNAKVNDVSSIKTTAKDTVVIYTSISDLENTYLGFNSPKAINKIASIENEYFNNYKKSESKYYGTTWYEIAKNSYRDSINIFDEYKAKIEYKKEKVDSMHCTIYAIEALKAGFGDTFIQIEQQHKNYWNTREYAGWSIAYILAKYHNWKAYLIISKQSREYNSCIKNFKKDKKYHVYKQPDIPLEKVFDFDTDKEQIDNLLNQNEFGWGFSYQGWHTWITRFDKLKECNWNGAPSIKYAKEGDKPLFIKTKFIEFYDYDSHIIVFPPKKSTNIN